MAEQFADLNNVNTAFIPVGIRPEAQLEKTAEAVAKVVAREYATYKLASAHAMRMLDRNVDDKHLALISAQNMVVKV